MKLSDIANIYLLLGENLGLCQLSKLTLNIFLYKYG